jgi:arsenate reductase (glutaredoxin)
MADIKIWHNPSCSKSRAALELLEKENCNAEVIEYLTHTPSAKEIKDVLSMLKIKARLLMRTKEELYQELNLNDETLSEDDLISAMKTHPKLIERPVVIKNNQAAIGRPIENIINLIG